MYASEVTTLDSDVELTLPTTNDKHSTHSIQVTAVDILHNV